MYISPLRSACQSTSACHKCTNGVDSSRATKTEFHFTTFLLLLFFSHSLSHDHPLPLSFSPSILLSISFSLSLFVDLHVHFSLAQRTLVYNTCHRCTNTFESCHKTELHLIVKRRHGWKRSNASEAKHRGSRIVNRHGHHSRFQQHFSNN